MCKANVIFKIFLSAAEVKIGEDCYLHYESSAKVQALKVVFLTGTGNTKILEFIIPTHSRLHKL